jgi:hypothetical protein
MQNLFHIDIFSLTRIEFKDGNADYQDHIIFDKNEVIQDREKLIDPKKLGNERSIAKKFLEEHNLATGLIILRNEIQKAFEFSKSLADFIKSSDSSSLTSKVLISHIKEVFNEKIQLNYLTFLTSIIKFYFKVPLPNIKGVQSFLSLF